MSDQTNNTDGTKPQTAWAYFVSQPWVPVGWSWMDPKKDWSIPNWLWSAPIQRHIALEDRRAFIFKKENIVALLLYTTGPVKTGDVDPKCLPGIFRGPCVVTDPSSEEAMKITGGACIRHYYQGNRTHCQFYKDTDQRYHISKLNMNDLPDIDAPAVSLEDHSHDLVRKMNGMHNTILNMSRAAYHDGGIQKAMLMRAIGSTHLDDIMAKLSDSDRFMKELTKTDKDVLGAKDGSEAEDDNDVYGSDETWEGFDDPVINKDQDAIDESKNAIDEDNDGLYEDGSEDVDNTEDDAMDTE